MNDEDNTTPRPVDADSPDDLEAEVDDAINVLAGDGATGGPGSAEPQPWERPRGPVQKGDRLVIGKVGAPPMQEATSGRFYFWVPPDALVEQTQLVLCRSAIAGRDLTFYAIVDEVYRRSRQANMGGEFDEADGDLAYEPPFLSEGYTFAEASILRVVPATLTPPRERSDVFLAQEGEAGIAYFSDEIEHSLEVGLVKNGGADTAGAGSIDLDYLLGENGGHMLVNGTSGRGSKSSFLLFVIWMLLRLARRQAQELPSEETRKRIVPIILNIKNFDLFHIDHWSNRYDPERHAADWAGLGVRDPKPFQNVTFYAAQQPGGAVAVATGRTSADVRPYSWALKDVIEGGLLEYLFAESDANDANFGALVLDIGAWLTRERTHNDGEVTFSLRTDDGQPATFAALLEWVHDQIAKNDGDRRLRGHHSATWQKLYRRLLKLIYESKGVLRRDDQLGNPLKVVRGDTSDPIVVDLAALAGEPELQRFVVATILRQLVAARTGARAVRGLVYTVMVDELNRFAPRGARDPITRLIETVAAEMRSQGIILLGAQQQASKVSERVVENAGIRVLGRTGSLELATATWRFLSDSAKRKAENLTIAEKLVIQDNFRQPMHVRVPFPAWAMNPRERAALPRGAGAPHGVDGATSNGALGEVDDEDMIDRD